jgi:hypothetical protein
MTNARLRAEHGFSMIAVMGIMLIGTMLAAAAFAAVGNDLPFARGAQDRKQAYQAAEAGIDFYKYSLTRDNNFWANCVPTSGTGSKVINQKWTGVGTRGWLPVPGSPTAYYSIELLPANGKTACDKNDPEGSMVDPQGTFRIRSTGYAGGVKRSIVASFRRKSFLDFLYFTEYETSDPNTYASATDRTWATQNCVALRAARDPNCDDIAFIGGDQVNGPFHTNDDILTCGSPSFGRTDHVDNVEISGPASGGYSAASGCGSTSPSFNGNLELGADPLKLPDTNANLAALALPGYKLTGTNTIVLNGSSMTVTNAATGTTSTLPLPSNGVIYDGTGTTGCTPTTPRLQNYTDSSSCAILYISGNASSSLTITSAADIVVRGNLTHDTGALIGLIATNNVRVYHPVTPASRSATTSGSSCPNATGTMTNVEIDAAVLSLQHTFIVDNWQCGAPLGTLTVNGAIGQSFRGPVGTYSGSTKYSGYTKNYSYDDRLKYRSPPNFLPPVDAAWHVLQSSEQVPANFIKGEKIPGT